MSEIHNTISGDEFEKRLHWPLSQKIDHAIGVIDEFYHAMDGKVYVAFSGGKDSTVLLWLVRQIFPDVEAVFSDTGLEYPEIRDFVKTIDNVTWIKPDMTFKQVIEKYGYPVISKMQAQYIEQYRTGSEYMRKLRWYGADYGYGKAYKISDNWKFMVDAPFKISDKCCTIMKKNPFKKFDKKSGKKPIIGMMATESSQRKKQYLQQGCNIIDSKNPSSRPLSLFMTKEIWHLIKKYNISYSSIYDKGFHQTGCMFCMFGVHLNSPNRFQIMAKTHPKIYKYCMEKLGIRYVMNYMGLSTEKRRTLWE